MTEEEARKEFELELLKEEYNQALERFNKMNKWCDQASAEEMLKHEKHIVEVIKNCNDLANEIYKHGIKFNTMEGFKE